MILSVNHQTHYQAFPELHETKHGVGKRALQMSVSLDCSCTVSILDQIEVHSPFRGGLINLWNLFENVWHNAVLPLIYLITNLMFFSESYRQNWNGIRKKLLNFQCKFLWWKRKLWGSLFKIMKAVAFHLIYMCL